MSVCWRNNAKHSSCNLVYNYTTTTTTTATTSTTATTASPTKPFTNCVLFILLSVNHNLNLSGDGMATRLARSNTLEPPKKSVELQDSGAHDLGMSRGASVLSQCVNLEKKIHRAMTNTFPMLQKARGDPTPDPPLL